MQHFGCYFLNAIEMQRSCRGENNAVHHMYLCGDKIQVKRLSVTVSSGSGAG